MVWDISDIWKRRMGIVLRSWVTDAKRCVRHPGLGHFLDHSVVGLLKARRASIKLSERQRPREDIIVNDNYKSMTSQSIGYFRDNI